MNKPPKLMIRKLKMSELLTFCLQALNILQPLQLDNNIIVRFRQKTEELQHYCAKQTNLRTHTLSSADAQLCDASKAFHAMLHAAELHPSKEVKTVARFIREILPDAPNPKRLSHQQMYPIAITFVNELNTLPDEYLKTTFLTDYLDYFRSALHAFIDTYHQKYDAHYEHSNTDGVSLTREVIKCFIKLYQHLNTLYQDEVSEDFMDAMNQLHELILKTNAQITAKNKNRIF